MDGRWRVFPYEELVARDKASLDITWLRDDSLEDATNLPDPDVIADHRGSAQRAGAIRGDLRRPRESETL